MNVTLFEKLKMIPPNHFVYIGTTDGGGWFFVGAAEEAIACIEQSETICPTTLRTTTPVGWTDIVSKEVLQCYRKNSIKPYGTAIIIETPTPIDGYWTYEEYRRATA